jgi:hypothetical protein
MRVQPFISGGTEKEGKNLTKMVFNKMWSYLGRFTITHVITYSVIAIAFLALQNALPASQRVALDFFAPYPPFTFLIICNQILRAGIMALVLYPFYDIIVEKDRGWLILFAALWGLVLVGSLEPKPGTIEGMIYTETTLFEHLLVLAAGAMQTLLFSWLFLRWETAQGVKGKPYHPVAIQITAETKAGYVRRYIFLHVLIYFIVGGLFYQISGYDEALATMEIFQLWRPLESSFMVAVVFLGQIFRGTMLALLLYPFYHTYIKKQGGWLLLFGLLFGLQVLGSIFSIPTTIADLIISLKTGIAEITVQTLLFSWFFFRWERKANKKIISA